MDQAKFKEEILSHEWGPVLRDNDQDSCWKSFKQAFISILDKHAPHKEFHTREDCKPWVTTELLENCNERDNIGKRRRDHNCPILKHQAKQIRNRVVSMKTELQRIFFQNSIEETRGDSSKLW